MAVLCVVAITSLAGCGGSSNSNSSGRGGNGGGSPTTVTYTFTGATPTTVATQIGAGSYTAATLQSGKLTLSIPSGTTDYAVAFLCPPTNVALPTNWSQENVLLRSTQDGASFTENCLSPASPDMGLATVQVDASAIPGASYVSVLESGYALNQVWSGSALTLSGSMVAGTYDVFVVVYDSTGQYPLAVRILRSQTIPGALNGGSPVVFGASDQTTKQTIAYDNIPPGSSPLQVPYVTFYTSGGQGLLLEGAFAFPEAQYPAMPAGAVQNGDYYTFMSSTSGGAGHPVAAELATSTGGPQTLTYPSPWTYSGPSATALPTFNFSYAGFSGMQSVVEIATLQWILGATLTDPEGTSFSSITVSATENYQNGATSFTIPNLAGLTGFLPSPPSGTSVNWIAGISQGTAFQTTPPNGLVQTVESDGEYTVP